MMMKLHTFVKNSAYLYYFVMCYVLIYNSSLIVIFMFLMQINAPDET